ncbi:MAG TPA: SHOCT domain-containing protein [Solirubrobacteraceae bacterium]|nr:SHOCT domain-containing protein [Solirubrobacteraceae bacterium]
MIAVIRPAADGARIVIGAEHLTGYRLDALDWHQANAIGLMLLDRMKSVLPGIPEPATGAPPVRSTADELETLAELRDRGLLTEDEYTAEKNKLLS